MTPKRKPGRPAGSGIYTVRRQIVLDPQLAEAWREMVRRIGGNESAHIRKAMSVYVSRFAKTLTPRQSRETVVMRVADTIR